MLDVHPCNLYLRHMLIVGSNKHDAIVLVFIFKMVRLLWCMYHHVTEFACCCWCRLLL